MKLCIPVSAPAGLESVIEPHLPQAAYLLFFDTESREFEQISLGEQSEGGGGIHIDAVLCGSINRVTLRTLLAQGIQVYGTQATTVAQAIAQYEGGELEAVGVGAGSCGGGCGGGGAHGHEAGGCGDHGHSHGGGGCCGGGGHGAEHEAGAPGCQGGGCGGHGHASGHAAEHDSAHGAGHHGGCGCGGSGRAPEASVSKPRDGVLRIAVSSQNRKTVTEHAGKARKFWIYEVRDGAVFGRSLLELPIEQSFHETGPDQAHPLDVVDVLLTGSIGDGLKQRLSQRGIEGVVTAETDPDQAVAAYLESALTAA